MLSRPEQVSASARKSGLVLSLAKAQEAKNQTDDHDQADNVDDGIHWVSSVTLTSNVGGRLP